MLAMASKPRGDRLSVGAMKLPAALLTSPVRPPLANSASTISSTACAMRMSTPKVSMRRFRELARARPSAVASHTALRRPQMATSAPSCEEALGHGLAQAGAAAGDQDALALHEIGLKHRFASV